MNNTKLYYDNHAQEFYEATIYADVTELYDRFTKYIPSKGRILDLGCGSGRDTKAFLEMGFNVDAIDGSEGLCKLASEYTGIIAKCMDYCELSVIDEYDAIWACASLLHLKSKEITGVLCKMRDALKPTGILYLSFKHGEYEGERDGRYYTDMTHELFFSLIKQVKGLTITEEWLSEDVRPGVDNRWYNAILIK